MTSGVSGVGRFRGGTTSVKWRRNGKGGALIKRMHLTSSLSSLHFFVKVRISSMLWGDLFICGFPSDQD